jgi:hypothetical protein
VRNDPRFVDEFGSVTQDLRETLREVGERVYREKAFESYWNRGVTCFSERPDDILLWSHYGGGHRGICLEFDTASSALGKLHKVTYTDDVPELNVVDELLGDGSFIMKALLTKAACWTYEREWRALHIDANKEYGYGQEALTGVYLGAALSEAERHLVAHMIHGSATRLYELQRSDKSLRLEVVEAQYTPFNKPPAESTP